MFIKMPIYFANALKVIGEVNRGEWEVDSFHGGVLYTIKRPHDNRVIWVANGAWFCESRRESPYFGLLFRHLVWWGAIKWFKDKVEYTEPIIL